VDPKAVGDLLVLTVETDDPGAEIGSVPTDAGVSWGGGQIYRCTSCANGADPGRSLQLLLGTVREPGPSTVTLSWYAPLPAGTFVEADYQEFSASGPSQGNLQYGPGTIWYLDTDAGPSGPSSDYGSYGVGSPINLISLNPTLAPPELYYGFISVQGSVPKCGTSGSVACTPGFTYATNSEGNGEAYDTNVSGPASAEASTDSTWQTIDIMVEAHPGLPVSPTITTTTQPSTTTTVSTTTTTLPSTTTTTVPVPPSPNQVEPLTAQQNSPDNWSGYVVTPGSYPEAVGTFTVPAMTTAATCNGIGYEALSSWVGIDGSSNSDLIQAGIGEVTDGVTDCSPGAGLYELYAWWEILPAPNTVITAWDDGTPATVNPGDQVTVAIWEANSGEWYIQLTDDTTGETFTTEHAYGGPADSAEWVLEAPMNPAACGGGVDGNGVCPLAAYNGEAFSGQGIRGSETALEEDTMDQGLGPVSVPSAIANDGFTVTYDPSGAYFAPKAAGSPKVGQVPQAHISLFKSKPDQP
jgi:hypothetical protein